MTDSLEDLLLGTRDTHTGAENHRAYVGPPALYDYLGAAQFRLLTMLGLREEHRLLDFGCGSLRAGRLFIPWLLPGRYFGVEPNRWLIDDAVRLELGADLIRLRGPRFDYNDRMQMDVFGTDFDMILAQSVFSHAGHDLFLTGLQQMAKTLAPQGQALFTLMETGSPATARLPDGMDTEGWVYPGCTRFTADEVAALADRAGLSVEPLDWFHPSQRWFRAVRKGQPPLSQAQIAALGLGRALLDNRVADAAGGIAPRTPPKGTSP